MLIVFKLKWLAFWVAGSAPISGNWIFFLLSHVEASLPRLLICNVKWILVSNSNFDTSKQIVISFLVSQAEASEQIVNAGNFVVGWYHSHPTFVPNPSLRDLETQEEFQEMFKQGTNSPFIALILSPYSGPINPQHKKSLISKFKCLMVMDNPQVTCCLFYRFSISLLRLSIKFPLNLHLQLFGRSDWWLTF